MRPNDKPWYNNRLRGLYSRKNYYTNLLNNVGILQNHGQRFRQAPNDYVHEVSLAKDCHEQSKYTFLINDNNSTKKLCQWLQTFRDLMMPLSPLIEVGGDIVTDDRNHTTD